MELVNKLLKNISDSNFAFYIDKMDILTACVMETIGFIQIAYCENIIVNLLKTKLKQRKLVGRTVTVAVCGISYVLTWLLNCSSGNISMSHPEGVLPFSGPSTFPP